MGVQTFSQFKRVLEARGCRIKFDLPRRGCFNLAVDMSSIIFERFKGDIPEEKRLELIYSDMLSMIEETGPAQVFLCTDGPQPKQKLQTQRKRFAGKSRFVIKSSLKTVFEYLAERGMPSDFRNVKVFYEYSQPGEGEMKAIAFNGFDDPSLPKLVFSKDNDVHMVLGLCSSREPNKEHTSDSCKESFSVANRNREKSTKIFEDSHQPLCMTRVGSFHRVESKYAYVPHDVHKIEKSGGQYEIVDVWRELDCCRWFLCLAATCIFGNDYVQGVWSGTQLQWSRVLERIMKIDLIEHGLNPERIDLDGGDVERALVLIADLCDKPSSFEEQTDLTDDVVEAYIEKIKWWLSYYRNVYVCYSDDQLGEDGSPVSAEMLMVCLSLVEFRSLKSKLQGNEKLFRK